MDNRPIGFLDSGVGGLTVVRELLRQLPHEDVVYIGDSARAPYGPRPAEQIRDYTWQMVNFLLTKNVKMIVLACNTATAVVWSDLAGSFCSHQINDPSKNWSDWDTDDSLVWNLPRKNPTLSSRYGSHQSSLSQICPLGGVE